MGPESTALKGEGKESIATIASTPGDALRFYILQARDEVIQTIRAYEYDTGRGVRVRPNEVRAKLWALWLQIESAYLKGEGKKDYDLIVEKLRSRDYEVLTDAYLRLNRWLYKKRLTQFDNKGGYDMTNVEAENRHQGL